MALALKEFSDIGVSAVLGRQLSLPPPRSYPLHGRTAQDRGCRAADRGVVSGGPRDVPPEMPESVWDFPRPPRLEPARRRVRVRFAGVTLADSTRALRVLETSQAPAYYVPVADVAGEHLVAARPRSWCEWKGRASYLDVVVGGRRSGAAAWTYPEPVEAYAALRDHVAFYAQRVDECFLDDERVAPNAGDFYGGWINSEVTGPFKGGPGTRGW